MGLTLDLRVGQSIFIDGNLEIFVEEILETGVSLRIDGVLQLAAVDRVICLGGNITITPFGIREGNRFPGDGYTRLTVDAPRELNVIRSGVSGKGRQDRKFRQNGYDAYKFTEPMLRAIAYRKQRRFHKIAPGLITISGDGVIMTFTTAEHDNAVREYHDEVFAEEGDNSFVGVVDQYGQIRALNW